MTAMPPQTEMEKAFRAGDAGYDGIVQLLPFTCMPDTIAKSILPAVSKAEDMPVLTLIVDEQTGKAGVHTRLEAFLDLRPEVLACDLHPLYLSTRWARERSKVLGVPLVEVQHHHAHAAAAMAEHWGVPVLAYGPRKVRVRRLRRRPQPHPQSHRAHPDLSCCERYRD